MPVDLEDSSTINASQASGEAEIATVSSSGNEKAPPSSASGKEEAHLSSSGNQVTPASPNRGEGEADQAASSAPTSGEEAIVSSSVNQTEAAPPLAISGKVTASSATDQTVPLLASGGATASSSASQPIPLSSLPRGALVFSAIPTPPQSSATPTKRKRSLPGTPDPDAEVIALSPESLTATDRFVCEICERGFPREQNLQLHRRGHNLPWKLGGGPAKEVRKRVYVCPVPTCVHHDPSRALGDLTGIKKHFFRKHGEKKYKCDKCSKKYAVRTDWKAHRRICGTK
ncbi:PREDICTED: protein indeterminate-domain 4, chloroplastic-like [Nelumbo nucifera]|uniref:Protein indeterminate-domain 4, chloroplastic-like n=2 Tax=Nelumbo nucifera TaxID=4432 RepID=A0A1U7ZZ63_NELNU|nr:PREDICTED: protein indeterminate-domain 4, chloroplastic-like [Nelumbo nucifera]XP_010259854.1 PREDICTED: protein indeterminate-domain 4, chloroplastic-like [Nelumbo nucifera]XP_010259855.1 PREDICTED: protein indeterminate-domain 4, chloroplastic-like [Nelumbo nucifera]XP_010259856.1 PREDICTED: protein indeterminate-domain 4, chloroplastic-like [Nelumbo nucifera]XP_010259858.1 PREDICTED: protein indeterminate-domain 4, chloroplastic-like [Nelumbo nucifera]DAD27705.1 TPA_asm: hypothetical pr